MGKTSITGQIDRVLAGMFHAGASRHEAKRNGTASQHIFSYETLRSYRERVNTALKALPPEHRPRMLRDLTPAHIAAAIGAMKARGADDAHLKTTLTAFRKLAAGMQVRGWHTLTSNELVPAQLYAGLTRPAARGGYSDHQVRQLRDYIANQGRGDDMLLLFDLLTASGLRHNEVARLREVDLDREAGAILVRGTNAKGGRQRTVGPGLDAQGRTDLHAALDAIPAGRNWLWTDGPALARRLQATVRTACDKLGIQPKGIHGLRAVFAEQFIERRMAASLAERAARLELTKHLGHNRVDVTYRYVPRLR